MIELFEENSDIKKLLELPTNLPYKGTLKKVLKRFNNVEFSNKEEVFNELEKIENSTKLNDNSLDILKYRDDLNKIQIFKDRISSLYQRANSENMLVEESYNILLKSWMAGYSKLSSDKKRENEAEFILSPLLFLRIDRKDILERVKEVYKNLSSKSEMVSRKVTIIQEYHKITSGNFIENSNNEDVNKNNKSDKEIGWGDL